MRRCKECQKLQYQRMYTDQGSGHFNERCLSCEYPACASCGHTHPRKEKAVQARHKIRQGKELLWYCGSCRQCEECGTWKPSVQYRQADEHLSTRCAACRFPQCAHCKTWRRADQRAVRQIDKVKAADGHKWYCGNKECDEKRKMHKGPQ